MVPRAAVDFANTPLTKEKQEVPCPKCQPKAYELENRKDYRP